MNLKSYYQLFKRLYHNGRMVRSQSADHSFNVKEKEMIKALNTRGIFITENFLEAEMCDTMRKQIDKAIDSKSNDFFIDIVNQIENGKENKFGIMDEKLNVKFWADKNISDVRIIKSENLSQQFYALAHDKKILEIGKAITNLPLTLNFQMANKVSFVSNNLGSGGGWHRDNNYSHGFKVLVYLDDVEEENGPFEYIPSTHLLRSHFAHTKKIDQYQFSNDEANEIIAKNKFKSIVVTAKKGSAVFFNTNGIHRGMPIEQGTRYAVTNYYN